MTKKNFKKTLALFTAACTLATALAGCSGGTAGYGSGYQPATETYAEPENTMPDGSPGQPPAETVPAQPSGYAWERVQELRNAQAAQSGNPASEKESEDPVVSSADSEMGSVENVARLGDLVGDKSLEPSVTNNRSNNNNPYVDVDNAHNPYDLTWKYGKMPGSGLYDQTFQYSWGKLYQTYVDAADWSLVFNAEYYKSAFPVLAQLYHDDAELLLEHFQTVGVHEGRQGSEDFNVAAYMENCSEELRKAFGDNYECYYFYYMLNPESEKSVETTGDYRTWQTVELSWFQADELEHVNAYRAEVGADPVTVDPEMMAFANLRAWNDAVNDVWAHDSLYDQFVDDAMENLDVDEFFENTVKCHSQTCPCNSIYMPWLEFRNSTKGHYEAMVNPDQKYFGSSNSYLSSQSGNKSRAEFDMFTPETPLTSR